MRLIDADRLLKDWNGNIREYGSGFSKRQDTVDIIKRQPTAYDVDKVVEELEMNSLNFGTVTLPAHYVRLNDAIEIVKAGVNDENN